MIPALGILFVGAGALMAGAMTYETTTGRTLSSGPAVHRAQATAEAPKQEDLRNFAAAHRDVVDLQEDYNARIMTAPDTESRERLRAEALERMRSTIAEHDLTVADYNRLYETARTDPAVRQSVMEELAALPDE